MELEKKVQELEVRALVAEKLANKAIDMAMDALVKVQAMKESTHKVEYVNPFAEEMREATKIEPEPTSDEPAAKLSPFNTFSGFKARRDNLANEDSSDTVREDNSVFYEDLDKV